MVGKGMIGDHRALAWPRWVAALAAALAATAPAAAGAETEIGRPCRAGLARVTVEDRVIWCAESRAVQVIAEPVVARRRDAVAFAVSGERGARELVVVLLGGEVDGHTMTWAVPQAAGRRQSEPTVMWLGRRRVGFGESPVRPAVVASWTLHLW
jgi:hypothetical protein